VSKTPKAAATEAMPSTKSALTAAGLHLCPLCHGALHMRERDDLKHWRLSYLELKVGLELIENCACGCCA